MTFFNRTADLAGNGLKGMLQIDALERGTDCRVTGIDGSCAKHLTVESYMVIYAPNSYTY